VIRIKEMVPRAVLGEDDAVLVVSAELVAGVELDPERSHMRAGLKRRRAGCVDL
jgi:hypothetical protein